jgi:hypothetical protein
MKATATHFLLVCALLCTLPGMAQTPTPDKPLTKEQIASSRFRVDTLNCGNGHGGLIASPGDTILLPAKDSKRGTSNDDLRVDGCIESGLTQRQCQGKKIELTCQCYLRASSPWSVNPADNFEARCVKEYTVNGRNLQREHELARKEAERKRDEEAKREQEKSGIVECMSNGRATGNVKQSGEDDSHCHTPKKGEPGYLPWN